MAALANLLRQLASEEIEIAVAYLSGETPHGKVGLGYAALQVGALFARASADERDFLARLIVGELRQGALEGVCARCRRAS